MQTIAKLDMKHQKKNRSQEAGAGGEGTDKICGAHLGWIGTGRMGYAMALRLLRAGCRLSVYNRTRAKAEPLAQLGATLVDNPCELGGCDIVFTMVSRSADLLEVTYGRNGLMQTAKKPALLVDCSSVSEETSANVRERAAAEGTMMLAAPVSGNAKVVEAGRLTVAASGPKQAFDRAELYLQLLGKGVTYVGEGELARVVKICHNLLLGVVAECLAEITVLAQKSGVKRHAFLEFINSSVMGSTFSRYKTPALVNLDFKPTFTLPLLEKDLDLGREAGSRLGVSLPVVDVTREIVHRMIEEGESERDFAVLIEHSARLARLALKPENVEVDDGLKDQESATADYAHFPVPEQRTEKQRPEI